MWTNPFPVRFFFSEIYILYHSDKDCDTKLHGGGALMTVFEAVFGIKHKSDLEYFQECVFVEIAITYGCNLLIGNHYFSHDCKVDVIKKITF
jgi:hypothetical protein